MTEHVHEWDEKFDGMGYCWSCTHKGCHEILPTPEIKRRLNATQKLSAEDAKELATLAGFALLDVPERGRSPSIGRRIDAAQAYADTLEGK